MRTTLSRRVRRNRPLRRYRARTEAKQESSTAITTRSDLTSESGKFFKRVCTALDIPVDMLVKRLNVTKRELATLESAERHHLAPVYSDPMWPTLYDYVSKRLGALLAVREELNRKLANDRRKVLARRLETTDR